ncbi:MAG TPA: hypothetical protein ENH82_02645 [bacterium]|nr:hypothetical protein [bacterium]
MLSNDNLQREIQKKIKERRERTQVKTDMIVIELAKIAFCDINVYVVL